MAKAVRSTHEKYPQSLMRRTLGVYERFATQVPIACNFSPTLENDPYE